MKKLLAMTVGATLLCVSLAACNGGATSGAGSENSTEAGVEAQSEEVSEAVSENESASEAASEKESQEKSDYTAAYSAVKDDAEYYFATNDDNTKCLFVKVAQDSKDSQLFEGAAVADGTELTITDDKSKETIHFDLDDANDDAKEITFDDGKHVVIEKAEVADVEKAAEKF